MISWEELIEGIEKLQKLPNGGGSEIGFVYQGTRFGTVSYPGSCTLTRISTDDDRNTGVCRYEYPDLTTLGRAENFGFSVSEKWKGFEEIEMKPDFDCYPFDDIYASYKEAGSKK